MGADRPILEKLVNEKINKDDNLYVWKIDRLGRSLLDGLTLIKKIKEKGGHIYATDLGTSKDQAMNDLHMAFLLMLAESETKRRAERQREGIARAKRIPGKYKGRKSVITPTIEKKVKERLEKGMSVTDISKCLGISRTTIYRYFYIKKEFIKKCQD